MLVLNLDSYSTFTDLYAVLGIPKTEAIILSHRGASGFTIYPSVNAPSPTQSGLAVSAQTSIRIPGYDDGRSVWFRGGTGLCIVQLAKDAIVPTSVVDLPSSTPIRR